MPLAASAIVLGLMAYPYVEGRKRTMAAVGIVLGVASVLFVVGCTLFA